MRLFAKVWAMKDKSPDAVLENFICYPFGPALVIGGIFTLFFSDEISITIQNFINNYLQYI